MKDDMIFGPSDQSQIIEPSPCGRALFYISRLTMSCSDFFFVIKFQNHGSEHDQGLLWVANAPNPHGLDSNQIIEFFVDKYITCDNDELTPNFHEAQRHHHKKNCRKKNQVICHFNLPWPLWKKHKFLNQYNFKIYPC
jgi:hypothetical protein